MRVPTRVLTVGGALFQGRAVSQPEILPGILASCRCTSQSCCWNGASSITSGL